MSAAEQVEFRVDGVRVLHFPGTDEVCHATLMFAVGGRDESVPAQGVLHALEHVVMHAVRRTSIEINAAVDSVQTQFVASGSPDKVAMFLAHVCRALADPPVDRLLDEVRVLDAEGESQGDSGWPMHRARYGFRDLGVGDAIPPATRHLTGTLLARYAETWFVAGNALLVLDGPVPERLELPLRAGNAPRRSWPSPQRWSAAKALLVDGPACAVNVVLPEVDAARVDLIAVDLLVDRLTEALRHHAGHTYVVDHALSPIAAGQWDLVVWAEPPEDSAVAAVQTMVSALRDLCAGGPSKVELDLTVERITERSQGRQARMDREVDRAVETLLGLDVAPPDLDRIRSIDAAGVTDYLRTAARDALYLAPEQAGEALAALGVPELPEGVPRTGPLPGGTVFRPPLLARAMNGQARGATIVLTAGGLTLDVDGSSQEIAWPDVVGVARVDDGDLVVFSRQGAAIPLGPGFYRRGKELVAAVTAHVGADLIYPAAELDPDHKD